MKKNVGIIIGLIIGVFLICVASIIAFTSSSIHPMFDLTQTGQIGDTIGGITSPIIGIIGSVLVYLSFRQQFLANQLQQDALQKEINDKLLNREYSQIETLFRLIKEDINSLEFKSLREPTKSFKSKGFDEYELEHYSTKGISSINEFKNNLKYNYTTKEYKLSYLKQLNHTLYQLKYIEQKIIRLTIPKIDKEYFEEIIKSYYRNILEPSFMDVRKTMDELTDTSFYEKELTKFKSFTSYLATIFNSKVEYDH